METLTLNNFNEFRDLISNNNIELSSLVVNTIKKNIDAKKGPIYVTKIFITDEDLEIELTTDPKEYIPTLEKNLEKFEYHEEYEMCADIKKLINHLKQN